MEELLYYFITVTTSLAVSAFVTYMMRSRIRGQAIKETLEAFDEVLTECADHFVNKCSQCGHSRNGHPCDNPDYKNIVMFSECTNFEEKRF